MTIYLDFDGTIVEHAYPKIGADNPLAIAVTQSLLNAGHDIILNTYRADIGNETIEEAIHYLNLRLDDETPIRRYTTIKLNPPNWNLAEAIKGEIIYIDDLSKGTPMRKNIVLAFGKMVDWIELEKLFLNYGIL